LKREGEAARLEEQIRTIHIKSTRKIPPSATGREEDESPSIVKEINPLAEFVSTCCELHSNASSGSRDLWKAYQRWVQETGDGFPVRTQKAFGQYLKSLGCRPYRTNKRRMWRGIALRGRLEENL
jgi:phage/plasmid-associated DNA primase